MSDLIDRQAILKHIEKIRQSVQMMDDTQRASIIMNGMYLCEKAVRNQPSAQPERKTGKWIVFDSDDDKYDKIKCDCCKKGFTVDAYHWTDIGFTKDDLNFCPNCGADMRGGQDG